MILAAGRGERLAPLTDTLPKPLIKVGQRRLIDYHLDALVAAGVNQVIINVAHLADQILAHLQDTAHDNIKICFSREPHGALETGGGICNALPLIESDPFIVVNADIWTDYHFSCLPESITGEAHLVLVPNPAHHPDGDFSLQDGLVLTHGAGASPALTYSGIGVYRSTLFKNCPSDRFALAPLLHEAIAAGAVSGEWYAGRWMDIGTIGRLQAAREQADTLSHVHR